MRWPARWRRAGKPVAAEGDTRRGLPVGREPRPRGKPCRARSQAGRRRPAAGLIVALFGMALGLGSLHAGELVWVEAERFADLGGWTSDAQFIDQMGSPYLLAIGLGQPVPDAATHVDLPRAGRWRLWVRTRDWMPEHHPGRFTVLINGQAAGPACGGSGRSGWHWEDGGVHELAGNVEIRLHDLSGYYGRCDALVLAADLDWTPPEEKGPLDLLRVQQGGVSREITDAPDHDVVVAGGGLAGCTAAVAAARRGARVALIQNRPLLGGNASTEILVPPVGVWPHGKRLGALDPRETGLVEEYRTAGNQQVREGMLYSERLLRFVKLEPNLDVYLNTHATGVELQPGATARIAAVLAVDVRTGQRRRFRGRLFLDCTGDSVVGVSAGAEYRHGKEPKSLHDEPWAPETASQHTMGNCLKYFYQDAGQPQPFTAPPWAYRFPACQDFAPGRHPSFSTSIELVGHQWMLELGGLRDTYADAEEIRDDLLRLMYGLWDHTKNHCPQDREKAANYRLVWVSYVTGKRENRRLIGDYVLTQNDIGAQTLFADRVAYGGWVVDDHHSAGFFHPGSFAKHYDDRQHAYEALPFSIPFRCLYSRNVENLLMAGRNISATHLAMADTRVMLTCAVMGQAVGTGAALCIEHGTTPRGLVKDHMEELQQQLLKDGAYLIALPNRDPRDLARRASVSASSERTGDGQALTADQIINGRARAEGDAANAWTPAPDAPRPHWVELAWPTPQTFNLVHVVFQTAALAPRRFAVEAWQEGGWRRIAEVAQNRHRRHPLGLDRQTTSRLRVVLDEPRGICEVRVYDEPEHAVEIARRAHANMRLPDQGPWLPWDQGQPPERWSSGAPPQVRGIALETAAKRFGGRLLDAADAELTGQWDSSTYSSPFLGDDYLTDGNEQKGAKTVRFRPRLPTAGSYEVRLAYTALNNRATNVPVTIHTARGPVTVQVNQRQPPEIEGLFHALGKFPLEAGEAAAIVVSNAGTDGYVIVDAVQLVPN